MLIRLKPHWLIKSNNSGQPLLVSELEVVPESPGNSALLRRLVNGVNSASLTDAEFEVVERLNSRGLLTTSTDRDEAAWSLLGAQISVVREQLSHINFSYSDNTYNSVGTSIAELVASSGVTKVDKFGLYHLVFLDEYAHLKKVPANVVPVLCNRMRVYVGPVQHRWTRPIGEEMAKQLSHLDRLKYELPAAWSMLQVGALAAILTRALAADPDKLSGTITEFNMVTMQQTVWPSS